MKKQTALLTTFLFLMTVFGGCKQSGTQNDDIITVDVTASYPKKELILQEFMDVEYIPLETSDEFITMGWVHAISKDIIITRNRRQGSVDGNIYIFDRNGKGLRVINRLGQNDEEYMYVLDVTLDEDNNEIFVNDHWRKKIYVYDLYGNTKRNFNHKEGTSYAMGTYNFDRDHLLCEDGEFFSDEHRNRFLVISKQNGDIIREIEIPYKEYVSSAVHKGNMVMPIRNRTLVPHSDNSWMLMENSSDIVYKLLPDYSMIPLITRTPSIQSMSPGVFLYPAVFTDRYCFMQTVKAEWDWVRNSGHKRANLVYDRKENAIFEYVVYNDDFTNEKTVNMTSEVTVGNNEIALVHIFEAFDLVEAYKEDKLKGKLKEIAATLDEESNPVLMLIKYKK
ncbi:MAG: 6-bladed beta-propeller [Tannerella sp.]|jgi:hypothetical protein|nr:6-bladed beta-propeller [Tannerella sp.]